METEGGTLFHFPISANEINLKKYNKSKINYFGVLYKSHILAIWAVSLWTLSCWYPNDPVSTIEVDLDANCATKLYHNKSTAMFYYARQIFCFLMGSAFTFLQYFWDPSQLKTYLLTSKKNYFYKYENKDLFPYAPTMPNRFLPSICTVFKFLFADVTGMVNRIIHYPVNGLRVKGLSTLFFNFCHYFWNTHFGIHFNFFVIIWTSSLTPVTCISLHIKVFYNFLYCETVLIDKFFNFTLGFMLFIEFNNNIFYILWKIFSMGILIKISKNYW